MENMVKEYRILTKREEELIDNIVEKSNLILKSANSIVNKINIIMDKLEIIIGEDMKMRSNITNTTGQNGQNTQYFSFDSTITSIDNLNKRLDTMITQSQNAASDADDNKNDEK